MTKEERIWQLEDRVAYLESDIDNLNIKLVEQNIKFKNIHKKVEAVQTNYTSLKKFVDKNDPSGIHFYDPKDRRGETLAATISEDTNKNLHDLKRKLEDNRLQLEKAKKLKEKEQNDLEESWNHEDQLRKQVNDGSNKFLTRDKKDNARFQREKEMRRGRIIYIPLAIVLGFAGCAISLPVGLFAAALSICGTVLVRKLLQNKTLKEMQGKNYEDMTKKEKRLYEMQYAQEDYRYAKQNAKGIQTITQMYQNAANQSNALQERMDMEQPVLKTVETKYQQSIKAYNSYLQTCNNKKQQMDTAKTKLDALKSVEDDIVTAIDGYNDEKQKKEAEVNRIKQEIDQLKNGNDVNQTNQNANNNAAEDGKGKRS